MTMQMIDTEYNEYVTPAQAALEFVTTEASVRNLIQREAVTVWRPAPRAVLVRRTDLARRYTPRAR
jgi:hypothetical protein